MIPDYQTLMRPVVVFLADGETRSVKELRAALAAEFKVSDEELAELLPSGKQRKFDSRVAWGTTYLVQAGLVKRPKRGHVCITEEGRETLMRFPERIDNNVLELYQGFRDFTARKREKPAGEDGAAGGAQGLVKAVAGEQLTPADMAEKAQRSNRAAVESEVLQAALNLSPLGFEQLVINLLEAMGYGRSGSLERTSATGDAGVDGIISQDPLGLDRIYVQAKRYAVDHPIDRPRIHEFAGALMGKQGDRGVYITTSRFTDGARREAERLNARIELIDGNRLAQLLVTYGVGVQVEQTITLVRLDEDFFEALN